ncbi:hypothetical protein BSL78_19094 [Apostichopus japonicus]|uniref:Uncharacterized protein n=1 Tax=Stichopus japonicus TaxID=307972 RepID=A0A2G8K7R3_STIJA|nr:hypothetical protein BSL78_19094 [Apostichopus japonicus]
MGKENPDKARLVYLQRKTFDLRRREENGALAYETYPFLLEEYFIIKEFNLQRPDVDLGQYKQNWNSLKEGLMRCAEQDEHVVTFIPKSSAKEAPRLVLIRHESSEYRNGFLLFNSLTIELIKTI